MKLLNTAAPVEISGGNSQSAFSIAMNAKAFRALSNTLYQNKIGSIVREVSSNAYDAHVAAGKTDVPFVVHLPDAFEPWFSVQDFGVGLSPDDMVKVYQVYFESTKDNSNEAIGAFGLGAKTPFSYTDQFTVTSVNDGVRRIYSAFISDSGVPQLLEMDCASTDEGNGVEVKMSVKRDDFRDFESELRSQLKFFPVKPIVKNKNGFAFAEYKENIVFENNNVAISSNRSNYGSNAIHIIQGIVGYPLDVEQVSRKVTKQNKELLERLRWSTTYIYFNIGEIGVTISREAVEYDDATVANIDAKLTQIHTELESFVKASIANYKTDWEKAYFLNSDSLISMIAEQCNIKLASTKRNSGGYFFDYSSVLQDNTKKNQYGNPLQIGVVKEWKRGAHSRKSTNATIVPSRSHKDSYIVLRDTNSKPNIRAKHFLSELKGYDSIYEIELNAGYSFDAAFIQKLTNAIGGLTNIKRLSEVELPAVEKYASVRKASQRSTFYRYERGAYGNGRSYSRCFESIEDMDEPVAYVVLESMNAVDVTTQDFVAYENLMRFHDDALSLIGIRKNDIKDIADNENFIPLKEYVASVRTEYADNKSLQVQWKHSQVNDALLGLLGYHYRDDELLNAMKAAAPKALPTRFFSFAKNASEKERNKSLAQIATFMDWERFDFRERVRKCFRNMCDRYPLLHLYNSDYGCRVSIPMEHLAKYVAAM
jgi:hypothetical protein